MEEKHRSTDRRQSQGKKKIHPPNIQVHGLYIFFYRRVTLSPAVCTSHPITHSAQIYTMVFSPLLTQCFGIWTSRATNIDLSSTSWFQHTMSRATVQGSGCLFCSTLSLMSWLHLLLFFFFFFSFCTVVCSFFFIKLPSRKPMKLITTLPWHQLNSIEYRAEIYMSWMFRQLFRMENINLQRLTVDFKQTSSI